MKRFLVLTFLLFAVTAARAQDADAKAKQLAHDLWKASGGEQWNTVQKIHFIFIVEDNGNELAHVEHDWDLVAQTDRVQWRGKDETVSVAKMPAEHQDDEKAAYGRWTNDGYWLLAPLKVLDPGVNLKYEGSKEVDGTKCEALRVSFEKVGMTPGDEYVFYIDSSTKLLSSWDYIPKPGTVTHGSWEGYQNFGPLKLSTMHKFGGKTIRFDGVEVKAAP